MSEIEDLRAEVKRLREENAKLLDALLAVARQPAVSYPVMVQPQPVPAPSVPQPWSPPMQPYVTVRPGNTCGGGPVTAQLSALWRGGAAISLS